MGKFSITFVYLLNFRRVTGMLGLGECQSVDTLPSTVYLSSVQTPPPVKDGYVCSIWSQPSSVAVGVSDM